MIAIGSLNKGNIIDVEFPFYDDKSKHKRRPAVVIGYDSCNTFVVLLKVTTHSPRTKYDYTVLDAKLAGLRDGSTVRCNQVLVLSNGEICKYRGSLTRRDFIAVEYLFNMAYQSGHIQGLVK